MQTNPWPFFLSRRIVETQRLPVLCSGKGFTVGVRGPYSRASDPRFLRLTMVYFVFGREAERVCVCVVGLV